MPLSTREPPILATKSCNVSVSSFCSVAIYKTDRFLLHCHPSVLYRPNRPHHHLNTVQGVRLLAERGCDLSKRDSQAVTPSFFAAQEGHADCLAVLLSLGADGGIPRADGATPLIIAAQNGHDSCVATLLNHPGIVSTSPVTSSSVTDGRAATIGATVVLSPAGLLKASAASSIVPPVAPREGLEHRTSSGYTALTLAVVAKEPKCVEVLLAAGAEVDAADSKGRSPLYLAAAVGDSNMCGLLLARGAQPRRKAADGMEPAIAAAAQGHASATRRIVKDAELDPAIVADAAGIPLSKYLADFKSSKHGNGSSHANGRGDGGKRVAALLPASVARLPPSANGAAVPVVLSRCSLKQLRNRPTTTTTATTIPNSNSSKDEANANIIPPRQPSTGGAPHSRPASTKSTLPRRKHPSSPRQAHPENTTSAARRSDKSGSLHAEDRISSRKKMLHRTWSGVHGGEDSTTTAGIETPGRRTPVRATSSNGVGNRARRVADRPAAKPSEEGQRGVGGGDITLLERMTAFLFDVEGEKKRPSSRE